MAGTGNGDRKNVALLWALHARPASKPRLALTVGRIATTAVAIADADGIEAVSMQRVAASLDVTKMALYRHVSSKAELVAVMIETAVGEPPDITHIDGGWRPRIERWAELVRATWQDHPWLPTATTGDRAIGPREIGWTESALSAFADTPLTGAERIDAVFLVSGHIRHTHAAANAGTQPWTSERRARTEISELLREQEDRFRHILSAVDDVHDAPPDNGWAFGLNRILAGLDQLIKEKSA
ncbi:TetR/AcrR family transcriptional regulator [Actinomadura rudentiformis]|uniref:TetR/AcrR family transcriptional regulator n=1 Tax=Actinomadura rudentiformis TaxID=359158 RepID=A0A6H9Z6D2_9ACTN|nr:helix-turn-helix domain-containing protein [Actinomadura rudentiformis]KAB2350330.1 TetR/AcrR family transcriptional regulator [Actinomadura rudentiformis]